MTDLSDAFGDDFAQHIKERTAERRQERNRVTEEQMKDICSMAINDGKFEEGDPQFTYTTDNGVDHTVMLVQLPDPDGKEVWSYLSEPWDGAARIPLEYLSEWYWSTFPDKKDLAKIEQGDWAIVAGSIEENEGDDGDTYRNIYPVAGLATLDEAKEYAKAALEDDGFADSEEEEEEDQDEVFSGGSSDDEEEEQEEDQESEEPQEEEDDDDSSSSSSGGGLGGLMDDVNSDDEEEDEEEPVPYEDIAEVVETLAEEQGEDEEPKVWEIEEGSEFHDKLTEVVSVKLDLENEDGVKDVVIDVIEGHREEEEEEEEEDSTSNQLF